MRARCSCSLLILVMSLPSRAAGQGISPQSDCTDCGSPNRVLPPTGVPTAAILVKGAWSSASDSVTPVPERGSVSNGIFSNPYFAMTYALPPHWTEKYHGPPPSESGRYVLAQFSPEDNFEGVARGSILVTAQDLFFSPQPATNAAELINYMRDNLPADYQVEVPPTETKIADHSFMFFAYGSAIASLHWYVLATQIRCHAVQITLTSRDTKLLEELIRDLNKMKLPAEASPTGGESGGAAPLCIQDYARDENMLAQANPVFTEHQFNRVPVRIIIGKDGRVRHIHFLSAFSDQARVITDALGQWKFKQYWRDGQPIEVETGILFGRAPRPNSPHADTATQQLRANPAHH